MALTILGLILLLSPFLLLAKYQDKKLAFAYILSFFLAAQLFIALITQLLHIFTYPVILTVNLIIFLIVVSSFKMNSPRSRAAGYQPQPLCHSDRPSAAEGAEESLKSDVISELRDPSTRRRMHSSSVGMTPQQSCGERPQRRFYKLPTFYINNLFQKLTQFLKNNWIPIVFLAIAFFCLYSVHYNYTGKYSIATAPEYREAKNIKYIYPYFADEWYSIAFVKDSIASHFLPLRNPLTRLKLPFVNFELAFHSFLAELFLLLRLNPLTSYPAFTVVSGLLVCFLIYLLLRQNAIQKLPAAIASLLALYITNGANLPGLWTLIPCILGIISVLLGFIFLSAGKKWAALLASIIVLFFYPPFFPFYAVALIFFLAFAKNLSLKQKINDILYYFSVSLVVGAVLSFVYFLAYGSAQGFFAEIISKLFYQTLTAPFNPNFSIFTVVPWPALLLLVIGIYPLAKKKPWLAAPLFLGLAFWGFYSLTTFRIIIEYERVVLFTSVLIIIAAGFGLDYLLDLLKKITLFKNNKWLDYIQIGLLICFLVFSFQYTNRDVWKNFVAKDRQTGQVLIPAAAANNYLLPGDLELFKNISNKNFLSFPWKGTVLGVATDNYPASTKSGTITIYPNLFNDFMGSNCLQKNKIAAAYRLDFVYSPQFSCSGFEFVNKNDEGLYLYRFKNSAAF